MSFLRDTSLSAVSSFVTVGGRMLVTVILARHLMPDIYGQFVFLQWVIELINLIFSFGLAGSMTRFLPAAATGVPSQAPIVKYFIRLTAGSVILSLAVLAGYLAVTQPLDYQKFAVLLVWAGMSALSTFATSALQGLFRYDAVTVSNLVFVTSAVSLALFFSPSVSHAAMVMALAYAAGLVSALGVCVFRPAAARRITQEASPTLRTIMTYATNIWITGFLANLVWSRGEFAILKMHVGNADLALYSAALSLSGAITQGSGLLTGALTPHLANHFGSKDHHKIENVLLSVTQAVMMFSSMLCIAVIAIGPTAITLLLGATYAGSYNVLCILAMSAVSISLGCAYTVLQIDMNGRFGRNANILALIVLLTGSAVLTPIIGIMGSAIARLLAQLAVAVCILWQMSRLDYLYGATLKISRAFAQTKILVFAFYLFVKFGRSGEGVIIVAGFLCSAASLIAVRLTIGRAVFGILNL